MHISYISDDLTVAFNDPTAGKTFADQFLQQNADVDVMFQVAGKTGNGVLQSVEENGIFGIGVDVDQWTSTPDSAECIVTSAEKKLTLAVSEGIAAIGDDGSAGRQRPVRCRQRGNRPCRRSTSSRTSSTQRRSRRSTKRSRRWRPATSIRASRPGLCYAGEADPGT